MSQSLSVKFLRLLCGSRERVAVLGASFGREVWSARVLYGFVVSRGLRFFTGDGGIGI